MTVYYSGDYRKLWKYCETSNGVKRNIKCWQHSNKIPSLFQIQNKGSSSRSRACLMTYPFQCSNDWMKNE